MANQMRFLLPAIIALSQGSSLPHVVAFQSHQHDRPRTWCHDASICSARPATHLASSLQNMPEGEDEISKLIGRRDQIKRKKKEDAEAAQLPTEPLVDLDLDKLPEMRTSRPVRRSKRKQEEEAQNAKAKEESAKSDLPIVDFKADYDDENELHITNRIAVTTASWGDPRKKFVASGKLTKRMIKEGKFVPGDLQMAHEKLLESGITFLETSPAYGAASRSQKLSAEHILKRCIEESPSELPETAVIESLGSSTWSKLTASRITNSLYSSVELMGTSSVELFQIPGASFYPSAFIVKALAEAIESGCSNYVGVTGVLSARRLAKLQNKLDAQDMTLTSNAFEFSLTNRKAEDMFEACRDMNIIPFVLNPLDGGLASGVYTASNPSGGATSASQAKFTFKELEKLQPLHSVQETLTDRIRTRLKRNMREIQERYRPRYGPAPTINTDITTTQVAINYVIAKGGVPLVEVNTPKQAEEVCGSLGWTLTEDEVDMLDKAAALCNL